MKAVVAEYEAGGEQWEGPWDEVGIGARGRGKRRASVRGSVGKEGDPSAGRRDGESHPCERKAELLRNGIGPKTCGHETAPSGAGTFNGWACARRRPPSLSAAAT